MDLLAFSYVNFYLKIIYFKNENKVFLGRNEFDFT